MPVIGRINGPAYGGGVGMISVCDIRIAVDTGVYSLTEVRLGLLPANFAPYVVARMGEANARRGGQPIDGAAQLADQGGVERIVGVGAIEREAGHAARVHFKLQGFKFGNVHD
jgi:enoyl-CoA hydratase/carnithine racemase